MTTVDLLLALLDQAYDHRAWHGTNLRGSLRGVTVEEAVWCPGPGRHNVQEVAVHAAYWKYAVHRRLTGEPRGSFALEGSDWFPRPSADPVQWRNDLQLLSTSHARLRAAVAALSPRSLSVRLRGSRVTRLEIVSGIAAHDLYHAGQIQLLKRLMPARVGRRTP
jgi:uncharacterized damage-inducible protein DinB